MKGLLDRVRQDVMARRSRTRRASKKTKTRHKIPWFLLALCIGSGLFFFFQISEWLGGVNRFLIRKAPIELTNPDDLQQAKEAYGVAFRVQGIPDYAHIYTQPQGGQVDTFFRIVGFENRLLIGTQQLEKPESIQQILTPRAFTGPLFLLNKTRFEEPLRRGFKGSHNIELPQSTYLILNGMEPEPSMKRFLFICSTGIVCIFSLLGVIKTR